MFVLSEHREGDAGLRLYRAALAGDLVAMAAALSEGAEVNGSISEEEGRTALIGAAVGVRTQKYIMTSCDGAPHLYLCVLPLPAGVAVGLRVPAAERSQRQPQRP